MTTPAEHRHQFLPAIVRDARGRVRPGARRCACGMEVTAGPVGLNVGVVRAGQLITDGLIEAMANLRRVTATQQAAQRPTIPIPARTVRPARPEPLLWEGDQA